MRGLLHPNTLARSRPSALRPISQLHTSAYGRAAVYRRIGTTNINSASSHPSPSSISLQGPSSLFLRSSIQLSSYPHQSIHTQSRLYQEAQPKPKDEAVKPQEASEKAPKPESSEQQSESASQDQESNKEADPEGGKDKDKKAEEEGERAAPPPHGDKTPWQVFTETLSTEFKKSKEWNESTKELASGYQEFTQNENLKRMQSAYEKASGAAASTTSAALKTTGKAIGTSATWVWDTPVVKGVRAGANATGRGIEKVTRPVRETEAFKNVKEVVDDGSSSRYGGWVEKEERRRRRELQVARETQANGGPISTEPMVEDPEAGTNVTLHKDSAWQQRWQAFRDDSKLMQSLFSMKSAYNESENPLISTARSVSDRIAGFFAENETALVIKKFREMDPSFMLEPFLQEMREYILPEVLDAYVKGDTEVLKLWLSAAQYQVYAALMQQYTTAGLKSDGRILDIRHVDILSAKVLDPGDVPIFLITCRTQEVHVYKNIKSGELAAGMDDRVQQVTYAIGVTRIPEDVSNPETRGWRLIELQKSARDYI